jgi:hypothetical protein
MSGPVDVEPLTARAPDQAPEASHEVAFDALQVSVDATPSGTVVGLALKEISGVGPEPPVPPVPLPDAPQPEPQPSANSPTVNRTMSPIHARMPDLTSVSLRAESFISAPSRPRRALTPAPGDARSWA